MIGFHATLRSSLSIVASSSGETMQALALAASRMQRSTTFHFASTVNQPPARMDSWGTSRDLATPCNWSAIRTCGPDAMDCIAGSLPASRARSVLDRRGVANENYNTWEALVPFVSASAYNNLTDPSRSQKTYSTLLSWTFTLSKVCSVCLRSTAS